MKFPFEGVQLSEVEFCVGYEVSYSDPDAGFSGPHSCRLLLVTTEKEFAKETVEKDYGNSMSEITMIRIGKNYYPFGSETKPIEVTSGKVHQKIAEELARYSPEELVALRQQLGVKN